MNTHADIPTPDDAEWLSLHEASALLGVNTSTLRRWGDSGRVPMKRTLGGHRRFSRAAIARLVDAPQTAALVPHHSPAKPPAGTTWAFDSHMLAQQEWHTRFSAAPLTSRMRGLGQRLLGLLIQYINRREDDSRFLVEARAIGESYGRESRAGGVSLHDTVEAFLFFRSAFAQLAMPLPGIAQPTDLAAAAGLHARLDHFMDAILLGVIAGFENHAQG
ncbi:MAG TPA: helix-turn-helix domain-containing protein [Kouleothrix sp.]|uniref:MerR family transcriptional regulator n=1 Tax=Kouleothrix sp. TaxID=2779161 RepID=UPI002C407FBB|nr:helix-turn-helix domain-containing protein [Kouleothrix sp.]HRC77372.1 helix-turn-helix domain-containing protein [Kouleothrix sp.]